MKYLFKMERPSFCVQPTKINTLKYSYELRVIFYVKLTSFKVWLKCKMQQERLQTIYGMATFRIETSCEEKFYQTTLDNNGVLGHSSSRLGLTC